ncbi:hypothetical protein ACHWQZ_G016690 [Mnemiopsis leidyi]
MEHFTISKVLLVFLVIMATTKGNSTTDVKPKCGPRLILRSNIENADETTTCDIDGDPDRCCHYSSGKCNADPDCLCHGCQDNEMKQSVKDSKEDCSVSEVNGFLKMVCVRNSKQSFRCPHSDQEYEISVEFDDRNRSTTHFTQKCDSDNFSPAFYQACGFVDNVKFSNETIACGWYLCEQDSSFVAKIRQCNERDTQFADVICDGKCDGAECVDESDCEGNVYGKSCKEKQTGRTVYLSVSRVCDGNVDCEDDADENICHEDHDGLQSCLHYVAKKSVPIHDFTRCSIFDLEKGMNPYCADFKDQTNCSHTSRIGGFCKVNGFNSSVSKSMICADKHVCDDNAENYCKTSSSGCRIHKHHFCDDVPDCEDNSDENHDDCKVMTKDRKCIRKFGIPGKNGTIPFKWILDDEFDCGNDLDENIAAFEKCTVDSYSFIAKEDEECKNVFLCPETDHTFVKLDLLCDSKESCGGKENNICKVSRDIPAINKVAEIIGENIADLCDSNSTCEIKEFDYQKYDIFGVPRIRLRVPTEKVDCSSKFGENYVFLSCLELCEKSDCPLNHKVLKHDSCFKTKDYNDRIITLATPNTPHPEHSHLTFVVKSGDRYRNDFFQCDNGRCVNYSQVCDLVNDCGDMSDELNCTNHFSCSLGDENHLISISQKCDNFYDCLDLSDECNDECTRNIIQNTSSLSPFCWVIGIFSVILNFSTLIILPEALTKCRNENVFFSKVLVMLISIGDFLMGTYLVVLTAYDNIIYKEPNLFCKNQAEWYTGLECKALGIISTIGSQLSLFSMTALSMFRLCKVLMNSLPLPVNRKTYTKCLSCTLLVTFLSVVIAVTPLLPSLEDYFVHGIHYDPDYQVFVGLNSKQKHISILQEFYTNSSDLTTDTSWQDIRNMVDGMFSSNYGTISRKNVHFYGNDGLCMFQYIVRSDDARGSRKESQALRLRKVPAVWTILIINLVCFVLILISAIVITYKTRKSSSQAGQKKNKAARKRNRSLELRILAIVVTDFLCWVPFIIICFLHNQGKLDSSQWYQALSLVILPLNSLINPLIYDRTITQFCKKRVNNFTASLGSGNANENGSPSHQRGGGTGMQMRNRSN